MERAIKFELSKEAGVWETYYLVLEFNACFSASGDVFQMYESELKQLRCRDLTEVEINYDVAVHARRTMRLKNDLDEARERLKSMFGGCERE